MPFGRSVTTFLADLFPDDHLAPQVTSDFVQALPPNPIHGQAVSSFVHELIPNDPVHPTDLGSNLSEFISAFTGPDLGDGGLSQDILFPDSGFVSAYSDPFIFV